MNVRMYPCTTGMGMAAWTGSGEVNWILSTMARDTLVYCRIGLGGVFALGAGNMNIITSSALFITGWEADMIMGTVVYLGAGWLNMIGYAQQKYTYAAYFTGMGSSIFVGTGGALFAFNNLNSVKEYEYSTTPYAFYISGTNLAGADQNKNMVVLGPPIGIIPFRRRSLTQDGPAEGLN